jgi:hypothetical protein
VPADKGTVYICRDAKFVGRAVSYTVSANGVPLAKLSAGSYFYHPTPGEVAFTAQTEAKTSVTADVKGGEVYYMKGSVGKLVPGATADAATK